MALLLAGCLLLAEPCAARVSKKQKEQAKHRLRTHVTHTGVFKAADCEGLIASAKKLGMFSGAAGGVAAADARTSTVVSLPRKDLATGLDNFEWVYQRMGMHLHRGNDQAWQYTSLRDLEEIQVACCQ